VKLLRQWLKAGFPFATNAVVAVPHDLTSAERRTMEQIILSAGAQQVYLVDESLVAGLGAGLSVLDPKASVTLDLGASSSRVALMALGKVTRSRVLPMGGDAMTEAVADYLLQQRGLRVGWPTAERVKHTVGCAMASDTTAPMMVDGMAVASGLPVRIEVTAAEICGALQPVLAMVADHLRRSLEEVQPQLLADGTPSISLVGGGAALAGMAGYLRQHIHLAVQVPTDSHGALAQGLDVLLRDRALRRAILSPPSTATVPAPRAARQKPALAWMLGAVSTLLVVEMAAHPPQLDSALTTSMLPVWQGLHYMSNPSLLAHSIDPAQRALMHQLRTSEEHNGTLQRELDAVKSENERLRHMMTMSRPAMGPHVNGQVVQHDAKAWQQSMTINLGQTQGITPGLAVTADGAVVGRIENTTAQASTLHTVTFPDATTAAMIPARHAAGVVYGVNGHLCEMRYLNPNCGVRVGDQVTTSGQDAYPAGYPIGTVTEIHPAADGVSWTASIKPAVPLDTVRDVAVLQRPR
jgi:rod shape-determining protein MreC